MGNGSRITATPRNVESNPSGKSLGCRQLQTFSTIAGTNNDTKGGAAHRAIRSAT